jgi:putative SOS response-associated peptidase YedK
VLRGGEIDAWLDTVHVAAEVAAALVVPLEAGTLVHHPVGKLVGRTDSDGPALIEPIDLNSPPDDEPKKRAAAGGQLDLF